MKAILTCFAFFSLGITVMAQNTTPENTTILFKEVIEGSYRSKTKLKKRIPKKSTTRLYLFKNSRIKKELAFKTKANKIKLA